MRAVVVEVFGLTYQLKNRIYPPTRAARKQESTRITARTFRADYKAPQRDVVK